MFSRAKMRLLPALIAVCIIAAGLRAADAVSRLTGGAPIDPVGTAQAQNAPAKADAKPDAKADPKAAKSDAKGDAKPGDKTATADAAPAKADPHALPEANFSDSEIELLQNLAKRRDELDKRDAGIQGHEAMLKVAEDRLNQKVAELNALKSDIEKLLDLQKQKQDDQVQSLVKIYSDMKSGDAARIFDTLDMPVLISVVSKMKEQKTAPILAAMQPDRARELTHRLADFRQLPSGPAVAGAPTSAPTALTPAAAAAAGAPQAPATPANPAKAPG